jgi:uncharacterized membrane protein
MRTAAFFLKYYYLPVKDARSRATWTGVHVVCVLYRRELVRVDVTEVEPRQARQRTRQVRS